MTDDPNRPSPAFENYLLWASGEPFAKKKSQIKHLARESALDDLIAKAKAESHSSKGLECPDYWAAVKAVKNFAEYLSYQDPMPVGLMAKASNFVQDCERSLIKSRVDNGWLKKIHQKGFDFYKTADGLELRKTKAASYLQKGLSKSELDQLVRQRVITKEEADNAQAFDEAMAEGVAEMQGRFPIGNENKLVSVAHPPDSLDGAKCEETDDPRFLSCSSDVGKAKHPSRPTHHASHSGRAGGSQSYHSGRPTHGRHSSPMGYHEEGNLDCRCDECMGKREEEQNEEQFDIRNYL